MIVEWFLYLQIFKIKLRKKYYNKQNLLKGKVMKVIKRNGEKSDFNIKKIREVINLACENVDVNPLKLESNITSKFKNNIKTSDIQDMLIQTCTSLTSLEEPEWSLVAGRLVIYNLSRNIFKQTGFSYEDTSFSEFFEYATRNNYYDKNILSAISEKELKKLNTYITPDNDMNYNIGSSLSLIRKYLIKNQRGTIELPQFADMAVSTFLNQNEKDFVKETVKDYKMISQKIISLATPFKSNLRKPNGNLSSCFIMEVDDNIESIMKSYTDMAYISKNGGGIGVYMGKIRPEDALIKGVPAANVINKWVKIANDIAIAVNQLGVRKGAITVATDIWHLDIEEFIEIKTEVGDLRLKAFDIYPQVVLNNKFIEAVKNNKDWYLLDRQELQKFDIELTNPVEFNNNYEEIINLIQQGKIKHYKKVNAKNLWKRLLTVYIETGDLYMCNKDNMNSMNPMIDANEFIQCANLCCESFSPIKASDDFKTEIKDGRVQNSFNSNLIHTCNLVSLNLTKILNNEKLLETATRRAVRILDKAIDITKVPVSEGQKHNEWFRTIGIGTLGTADWMAYNKLRYNKEEDWIQLEVIYEKISYYAFDESANIAKEKGNFKQFNSSNFKNGILLGKTSEELTKNSKAKLDWNKLTEKTSKYMRNMLLVALAPNTGTAVLMSSSASYLPIFAKFFNESMENLNIPVTPEFIKTRFWYYNESFTVPTENIIRLTNRLQYWIDTGMSMELIINPEITNIKKISDALLDTFSSNLKTVYYSRTLDMNSEDKKNTAPCVTCAN